MDESDNPQRVQPLFIGELVKRRHPILIALVFAFALFLAAVPLLFKFERNPYSEALALYRKVCETIEAEDIIGLRNFMASEHAHCGNLGIIFAASHLRCVDHRTCKASLERRKGEAKDGFTLTLQPANGPSVLFTTVLEAGEQKWWPPMGSWCQ